MEADLEEEGSGAEPRHFQNIANLRAHIKHVKENCLEDVPEEEEAGKAFSIMQSILYAATKVV